MKGYKFMFRVRTSLSGKRRLVPVLVGAVVLLALLIALGGVISTIYRASASGGASTWYVQTTTSANTEGDHTFLSGVYSDDSPNSLVLVTANQTSGSVDTHQVGVRYDPQVGEWSIFNEDASNMPLGVSFNVFLQGESADYVQTATAANTVHGYIFYLDNPHYNNNPQVDFQVTQNWNPGGNGGISNNHPFGLWYDSSVGKWALYNEDGGAMTNGVSFNVFGGSTAFGPDSGFTQANSTATAIGGAFCFNNTILNGNPDEVLYVTHVYSGDFTDVAAVSYNASIGEWCIVDASGAAIPLNAEFTIFLSDPQEGLPPPSASPTPSPTPTPLPRRCVTPPCRSTQ